jgi:hypothetical protein
MLYIRVSRGESGLFNVLPRECFCRACPTKIVSCKVVMRHWDFQDSRVQQLLTSYKDYLGRYLGNANQYTAEIASMP